MDEAIASKRLKRTFEARLDALQRRQAVLRAQRDASEPAIAPPIFPQSFELDLSGEDTTNPFFLTNNSFGFPISCEFPALWVYGNSHICTPLATVKMPSNDQERLQKMLPNELWRALNHRIQPLGRLSFWVVVHSAPKPHPCQQQGPPR